MITKERVVMNYQLAQERGESATIAMPTIQTAPSEQPEVQPEASPLEDVSQVESIPVDITFEEQKEADFKELRAAKKRVERERDEAIRLLRERETAKPKEVKEDVDLSPNDLVEWRHVEAKIKNLEERLEKVNQNSTQTAIETRLKSQYPDIETVVSRENLERLRDLYPEEAEAIDSIGNLYHKAVMARTIIKNLGIQKEKDYKAEVQRAQANASKPKPSNSIAPQSSDSPLTKANAFAGGLTDELKKQLLREMSEARKGI